VFRCLPLATSTLVRRIVVATDGSERAARAVGFAAEMAERYGADLVLLRVFVSEFTPGTQAGAAEATRFTREEAELRLEAERRAGPRGRARVAAGEKPAYVICQVAEEEEADVLVLGNAGMTGRKEFLLGNVPNWVSHNAPCTVIIVDTSESEEEGGRFRRIFRRQAG
jgi:ubiquinone biosynthesis protein